MYINPHKDMFQYLVLKDGTMQCINITYLKSSKMQENIIFKNLYLNNPTVFLS